VISAHDALATLVRTDTPPDVRRHGPS
jgi:hypothetical protein